jgi:Asp-tRNA(Asn)/Glu-tRNA(Gln) amidotransferase A subunit family amidase
VAWVGNLADEDSLILQILWEAGAVFHARTTEPQSLMHLETSSNIFGYALCSSAVWCSADANRTQRDR